MTALRVLLVEDNPVNRKVAVQMLEKLKCRVECAENGELGLHAWRNGGFDLLLVDCQMPGTDGFALTGLIREEERRRGLARTPIVAITAYAMPSDRDRCLLSGMDDHLGKPVLFPDLSALLARFAWGGRSAGVHLTSTIGPAAPAARDSGADLTLDPRVLASLRALESEGDPGLVAEMASIFVTLTPERIRGIREAASTVDFVRLERLSHDLKSSCTALGAAQMGRTCAEIEASARGLAATGVNELIERLEREFSSARGYLDGLRRPQP